MAQKPQLPKGKGRGRYDKTHQIALLTDFEVEALNHLRWKEKDRGESSGSGEFIRELAAKNSRPFEFVDYKGEKIPTLNDSSDSNVRGSTSSTGQTTYSYGGGGGGGGNGGYQESAWAKKKREQNERRIKREREVKRQREEAKAKAEAKAEQVRREEEKRIKGEKVKKLNREIARRRKQRGEFYGDGFIQDDLDDTREGYEGGETLPQDEFGGEEYPVFTPDLYPDDDPRKGLTAEEYHNLMTTGSTTGTSDDGGGGDDGMSEEEFNALAEELELKPEFADSSGEMHWTQEDADFANQRLLDPNRAAKVGEAEGFQYGTAVTDEEGTVTDESLTGGYKNAYEQMLANAYDASKTGIGLETLGGGQVYTDPYQALEDAVSGQESYLDTLASNYQAQAQGQYDDWLATNTANINALTNLEDIEGYSWTDMPEYDTDFSGGIDPTTGEWDADWMPEFYSGFTQEYGDDNMLEGWEYDDQGTIMPGSYNPATGSTTSTEGVTTSKTAPGMAPGMFPGKKTKKKGPSGITQYGSSSARLI